MSSGRGKYRGDRAGFGVLRANLTETSAIEGQQSFLRRGYDDFLFLAVRQQGRSKSRERRRRQVPAGDELPGGDTIKIVFQKTARPANIKVGLKKSRLAKDCGRADQLKAGSHRRSEWSNVETDFLFCLNFLRGKPQCPFGAPARETNHQGNQCRGACHTRASQPFPRLLHGYPRGNPACVGVPISFLNLYCKSSARAFSAQTSGIIELLFCTAPCRATHSVFRWTCMNIILSTRRELSKTSQVVKPSLFSGVSDLHPMYEEAR